MWDFPLVPESASTMSGWVDISTLFTTAIVLFFLMFVAMNVLVLAVRYRHGMRAERADPPQTDERLELLWIAALLVIVMLLFGVTTAIFFMQYDTPPDASTIYVVGKQWMWKIEHPEGKKEINELHVPTGRP